MKSWIRKSTNKLRKIPKKLESLSKVCWSLLNWLKIELRSLISPIRIKVIFLSFSLTTRKRFSGFMKSYSLTELVQMQAKESVLPWLLKVVVVFTETMLSEHSVVETLTINSTPASRTGSSNLKMHKFWTTLDKIMLTTIRQYWIKVASSQITSFKCSLIKKIKIKENICQT